MGNTPIAAATFFARNRVSRQSVQLTLPLENPAVVQGFFGFERLARGHRRNMRRFARMFVVGRNPENLQHAITFRDLSRS